MSPRGNAHHCTVRGRMRDRQGGSVSVKVVEREGECESLLPHSGLVFSHGEIEKMRTWCQMRRVPMVKEIALSQMNHRRSLKTRK